MYARGSLVTRLGPYVVTEVMKMSETYRLAAKNMINVC